MVETEESLRAQIELLKQRCAELESRETQLNLVIEATGVGIWDWQVQTGETVFNERWANIIGYTLDELAPVSINTWMEHAHPEDLEESNRLLQENWDGKTDYYVCESRMKHKAGHWVWVYDTGRVIEWVSPGVPKRMIGTHLDITEQKNTELLLNRANLELEELVRVDPLSKLANRRGYDERLRYELANAKRVGSPLSLLIIDIDYFKKYNDIYGHEKGDSVIQEVAECLLASLRRATDFAARYGGEEFVVLLPATSLDKAASVCNDILNRVAARGIAHDGSPFDRRLTVSIGASSTEKSAGGLLKSADEALYEAKGSGRNQCRMAVGG